jgi:uncharacterized membrane protein YjgN (DUF898 family)
MQSAQVEDGVKVAFAGTRAELFGIILRGYLLMVPTFGIYRFWLTTWKRRFYWSRTSVGGDALEYTGSAMQLLLGFLFALVFFVPIYGIFFYLSTQTSQLAVIGYLGVAAFVWFLSGYAIYRARDFRLSRTLWRGIRFDQRGSAWAYALRRFLWSVLMILSLGLVYPFMAGNLWSYRYRNTWFGDRQFGFTGSWRQVAGPYYLTYLLVAFFAGATFAAAIGSGDPATAGRDSTTICFAIATVLVGWLGYYRYQARITSRLLSTVSCGEARLTVHVRARSLLWQFVLFALALLGIVVAGVVVALGVFGYWLGHGFSPDPAQFSQAGIVAVVLFGLAYLAVIAIFSLLSEVFLGYGYWMLVARGASIARLDSLDSVRAAAQDKSLAGEGLADALNVGAY